MKIRGILVPTDLSTASDEALDYAVQLAGAFDASIHLLNVVEMPVVADPLPGSVMWAYPSSAVLDEARHFLEDMRSRLCVRSSIAVEKGVPAEAIVAYAREHPIDLIVMATHGRRGLARMLMGSTTESVLRRAPCPVVSIRPGSTLPALEPTEESQEVAEGVTPG
jgi:glycine betaine transporter